MPFRLSSEYNPQGDQHQAIEKLVKSLKAGNKHQTLLGVTGFEDDDLHTFSPKRVVPGHTQPIEQPAALAHLPRSCATSPPR